MYRDFQPTHCWRAHPLSLAPSQENYPQTQSSQPIQQQSDAREKYYRDFAEKAKNLSRSERKKLINTFSQKQKVAQKNGNYDEAGHYLRLMEILSKGD